MKLAEALVLRADIQKRIEELRERLKESALIQEGEKPPEDPQELLAELDRLLKIDQLAQRRRELDTAIQATNWAADLIE